MMVQSPLRKHESRPNLRKVPKPDIVPSSSAHSKNGTAQKRDKTPKKVSFPKLKPGKVILATLLIGVLGFLYLTHVFATQKLLIEVQKLEQEYNQARHEHDELKLKYDRMIGPSEIYNKVEALGFINGGPADKVIRVKE